MESDKETNTPQMKDVEDREKASLHSLGEAPPTLDDSPKTPTGTWPLFQKVTRLLTSYGIETNG